MKSSEAGFRKIAPWIDRTFRFIEMIGITALLSVIVPELTTPIQYVGTAFALYYLLEPLLEAISYWLIPEINHYQDVIRMTVVLTFLAALAFGSSFIIVGISNRISHTISMRYPPESK